MALLVHLNFCLLAVVVWQLHMATPAKGYYIEPNPMPLPHVSTPLKNLYSNSSLQTLPSSFSWRNATNGQDYTSPIRNQFLPQWCGSCWAHAVTSAMADRVNILNHGTESSVMLSVQNLLDCGWTNGDAGSCNGGSWEKSFEYARTTGIADDSCSPYLASDRNCLGGGNTCKLCFSNGTCVSVPGARKFHVHEWDYLNASSYGSTISDPTQIKLMKKEILERGPIVCSMWTEDDYQPSPWHCYEGGVYTTNRTYPTTNHVINLLGWGVEEKSGVEYWIGRHSGGTMFGIDGFFHLELGKNRLNIESHCGWATIQNSRPARDIAKIPCENGVPRRLSASEL